MGKAGVTFTKDNEYYTPSWFVQYFGTFDYDPATTPEKAADLNITHFDTIDSDGLETDWTKYKRIWLNPPFTRKHEFLRKAQDTYNKAKNDIYVLFPIEFLTTKRFHDICKGGRIYMPNGRVNFESGLGKKGTSPAFGSVVMKFQDTFELEPLDFVALKKSQHFATLTKGAKDE